ncbi:unnamed protein product [Microthlaspi erraticum]|uniref:F-box domain-containing protein n=1 Tax=Microthlaspi erraticum TaxID=1685480 RepID=A0A6D2L9G6_9BRAS|nr:unnamed protein product [Microthlaspi erraticum]
MANTRIMNRGEEVSVSIPNDLVFEISSRLPAKSVGRFRCVSKQWGSMLRRPDFTELFLTRSRARPRLLFAIEGPGNNWSFFSSPQTQNPHDKCSSLLDFHKQFPRDNLITSSREDSFGYASGLIYLPDMWFPKENDTKSVICNPITGQYLILPELIRHDSSRSFLGFDPTDKQHKVLFITCLSHGHKILTLGTGNPMRWRKIKSPLAHEPESEGICINGVLYYLASTKVLGEFDFKWCMKIACFDVRSEEFKFIDDKSFRSSDDITSLINYKGKLGVLRRRRNAIKLSLWVLDDVERQKWLNYVYTKPKKQALIGVTGTGEMVWSMNYTCKPFCVYYRNPEGKPRQTIEIKGVGANYEEVFGTSCRVHAFIDHVEDLSFMK